MEIKSLRGIGFDIIFRAFSQAFAEYEVQQDEKQLQSVLKRRGFNPDLPFAVFDKDQIVAFTIS